jgi:predicted metal-dependent hydrolase
LTPKYHQLLVHDLIVEVVRKRIKHMHLSVRAPDGRVRVSVPLHVDDEVVRGVVIARLAWIRRQQVRLEGQEVQPRHRYVSGERHALWGREYLLEVTYRKGRAEVVVHGESRLEMFVRPGSDVKVRERVLMRWYRKQLEQALPALTAKWEAIIGVQAAEWRVRQMRTRWGSCNVQKRRIWLNLELAKRSSKCLEYIIVHELVHLLERRHNRRFKELMDRYMPGWRRWREQLNRVPLGKGK